MRYTPAGIDPERPVHEMVCLIGDGRCKLMTSHRKILVLFSSSIKGSHPGNRSCIYRRPRPPSPFLATLRAELHYCQTHKFRCCLPAGSAPVGFTLPGELPYSGPPQSTTLQRQQHALSLLATALAFPSGEFSTPRQAQAGNRSYPIRASLPAQIR